MTLSFFRQLRAYASPESISRRDVFKTTGVAAASLLMRDRLLATDAPAKAQGKRVLVIGAGFAGLACADELAYAGYRVTVVEARNRVGGRVKSNTALIPGQTLEEGGELVGPNQPTWVAYAKRFGLKFVKMESKDVDTIELDGKPLAKANAEKLYKEVDETFRQLNRLAAPIDAYRPWEHPNAKALDARSLADWIDRLDDKKVSRECKRLMVIQFTAINGVTPSHQSLLMVLAIIKGAGLDKFFDETDSMHVQGGCDQLAGKLKESLDNRKVVIHTKCAVLAIRITTDHVAVTYSNGKTESWDDVVLTAPASVWSKMDFFPALPAGLTIPYADNVKYLALCQGQPWNALKRQANAMSDANVQYTWETTDGTIRGGSHAVVALSGGPAADVCRGWVKAGIEKAEYTKALDRFWPGFAKVAIEKDSKVYDWLSDPHSRGSYSCPAPGQVTVAGPILDNGIGGRLHFAGEHCCYAFLGWMEGALASGVRLAAKLCARDGLNLRAQ